MMIAAFDDDQEELIEMYIKGKPESIYSKLAAEPVLRTYVLSLISSGFAKTKQDLLNFFVKNVILVNIKFPIVAF
jgi:helicase